MTTSNRAQTIVLVEDESELASEIRIELERLGHLVRTASITEAADAARVGDAALLIMDRIVFGEDSLATLQVLRKEGVKVPVLVISALSSLDERVRGLRAGGDDYLAKPFAMVELVARVEALLRRLEDVRTTKLRAGDLEMDLIEQTVYRGGTRIDLLPREFKLLEYFLRHQGRVITRAMLLQDVWQYHFSIETNVVDVHISNLRKKIDVRGVPSLIVNIRGAGFMLNANA
ncbi:response regulator transcription factor [Bradyrhizobium sp.]|jgi:two-component system, OmpR family, response regulator|uniref:response regulator transcription factor n=1 Tax=Bradyrhizobium sp. TaxID=376 RepID=UPI002C8DE4F3|nr:response regulator transcription factor [Bradyrhizobium sp.]HWX57333.1 response regulator transcription factor [Bradyrhizobium sp.]